MNKEALKILVVDDEVNIIEFIEMGLLAEGYQVITACDGIQAVSLARLEKPDLVVLDLMLPGLNGFEVCQEIKRFSQVPIIMLTAKDEMDSKIKGLYIGADDYMVKPFSFKELSARIHARLRHVLTNPGQHIILGPFAINDSGHEIYYQNRLLQLSLTEYNLLLLLLKNKGVVMSKQVLLEKVWGADFYGDDNIVEVYIKYLRKKLEDDGFTIIKTVRGVGYKVMIE